MLMFASKFQRGAVFAPGCKRVQIYFSISLFGAYSSASWVVSVDSVCISIRLCMWVKSCLFFVFCFFCLFCLSFGVFFCLFVFFLFAFLFAFLLRFCSYCICRLLYFLFKSALWKARAFKTSRLPSCAAMCAAVIPFRKNKQIKKKKM